MELNEWVQMGVTFLTTLLASSGLWSFMLARQSKKNAYNTALCGLLHIVIVEECLKIIKKGTITKDEFETLNDYLYAPYRDLGGNGVVEKLMTEIKAMKVVG